MALCLLEHGSICSKPCIRSSLSCPITQKAQLFHPTSQGRVTEPYNHANIWGVVTCISAFFKSYPSLQACIKRWLFLLIFLASSILEVGIATAKWPPSQRFPAGGDSQPTSQCVASQTPDLQACSQGLNSGVRAGCLPALCEPCKHILRSAWSCPWGRRLRGSKDV